MYFVLDNTVVFIIKNTNLYSTIFASVPTLPVLKLLTVRQDLRGYIIAQILLIILLRKQRKQKESEQQRLRVQ